MSRPARFELRRVEHRGRRIAVIEDRATGEVRKVHRRGSRILNFKDDTNVSNVALKRVAREALA